jgi:hypothetical protein
MAVVFVTYDSDVEAHEDIKLKMPPSVYSVDVLKAGTVFTSTPAGEMTLLKYFNKVENKMKKETFERNRDVFKINALMAKNALINQRARKKMNDMLNKKIDLNAKRAKEALANQMRRTQKMFADAAKLANQRQNALNSRMKKMSDTVAANKAQAAHDLKVAVLAQQRALSAQASMFNKKIRQTNARVSENSKQMKANAKHAASELAKTMKTFNHKLNNFREEARKGRSALATQMAAQDKKTRAWASAKLAGVMASTAAQFQSVRKQMLKDRQRADRMVAAASSKMTAALSAQAALEEKNFQATMKNVAAAKAESAKKLAAAKTSFKMGLLQLSNTVKRQETKLSARISQVAGQVASNKAEQAKVNAKRNAEMKRIVKVGNERETKRLASNKALSGVIKANAKKAADALSSMRADFQAKLGKLQKYAEKSRRMAKNQLASATAGLYRTIAKQVADQAKVNAKLKSANSRARLDAADALRRAKDQFRARMKRLEKKNAKIAQSQADAYSKLTGVVAANAAKSASGRKLLRMRQRSQHAELKGSISAAVRSGEKRSAALLLKMKGMNKATRVALANKVSVQIARVKAGLHRSLAAARLASKKEREQLKKEMTFAISAAKSQAKAELNTQMGKVKNQMASAARLQASLNRAAARDRAAIRRQITAVKKNAADKLRMAVAGLNRARLALADQTAKDIKKVGAKADAEANKLKGALSKVNAKMTSTYSQMNSQIAKDAAAAKSMIKANDKAAVARYTLQMSFMKTALAKARKSVKAQFKKAYGKLAAQDARAAKRLAGASNQMNDKLAKQAALTDSRFKNTVKNIASARAAASREVAAASRSFRSQIVTVTASVKNVATRLQGEVNVVSGEVRSNKRQQALINSKVQRQMKSIVNTSNKQYSAAKRARGQLRKVMNANKKAASAMVAALARSTRVRIGKIRAQASNFRLAAAKDLTRAAKRLSVTMAKNKLANKLANKALGGAVAAQNAKAQAAIKKTKSDFNAKLTNLANTVAANAAKNKRSVSRLTGVIASNAKASAADRKLIGQQQRAMGVDLNKAIARAIQIGESKANAVADRAAKNLKKATTSLKNQIAATVEKAADQVFATVNGGRQKIADNYLSLKAYCVASKYKWNGYRSKSKQALVSIGDLCVTLGGMSQIVPKASPGIGMGSKKIRAPFSGKSLKGRGAVKRINGLVDEYMKTVVQVRNRWPFGIGKYLLSRLESSMQGRGVLEVAKVGNSQSVFINARAVGLSNRLSDFRGLAVSMKPYEATLAKLTSKLAARKKVARIKRKQVRFSKPQWQGN